MNKYTYLEAEQIAIDYEEQVPLKEIAEYINCAFHDGKQVRTVSSVKYAVNRWNNDDEWVERLEKSWRV
ncbi:hypothetical protein B7C51_24825 (plasmid) [Paenibacillus larvae subsp. pulvifaciens]|uniref:Phage protein n=1 Tax=Paenibacillus larvae subsp. pulvifaciens TaxID=1477 RepID=A0A1V0V024_9BACL|nr:hypothetical protein [Paenibacillus larvae]ARF70701.1 hypothetical protein B7C51_24825 [Paenibacillus larvae subsp. pulvifaciens]